MYTFMHVSWCLALSLCLSVSRPLYCPRPTCVHLCVFVCKPAHELYVYIMHESCCLSHLSLSLYCMNYLYTLMQVSWSFSLSLSLCLSLSLSLSLSVSRMYPDASLSLSLSLSLSRARSLSIVCVCVRESAYLVEIAEASPRTRDLRDNLRSLRPQ